MTTAAGKDQYLIGPLLLILALGALAGALVFAGQIFLYLKAGTWISISVLQALQWAKLGWAISPTDWLGAHQLLENLPLAPSLSISGSVPVFVWYLFNKD